MTAVRVGLRNFPGIRILVVSGFGDIKRTKNEKDNRKSHY